MRDRQREREREIDTEREKMEIQRIIKDGNDVKKHRKHTIK